MAIGKKKGLRFISVDNRQYYWGRFISDLKQMDLIAIIGCKTNPHMRFYLKATHANWIDIVSCHSVEREKLNSIQNEITAFTPKHIASAIRFAELRNWRDLPVQEEFVVRFKEGEYLRDSKD